ncbi:MAG: helix-turn-helix domain-containing protein [Janthinobacterium lividum]
MNAATLIEHLGGVVAAAKLLSVSRTTVYGWIEQGCIPSVHIVRLHRDHGYSLDVLDAAMPVPMRKASGPQASVA